MTRLAVDVAIVGSGFGGCSTLYRVGIGEPCELIRVRRICRVYRIPDKKNVAVTHAPKSAIGQL